MAIGTSQAFRAQNLRLLGNFYDKTNNIGNVGYRLNSTGDGTKWLADTNENSGILTGGVLTATIGGTTFNVSAGNGQIVTNSLVSGEVVATYTKVSWSAQNSVALTYRTSHQFSYIYIDENGSLQQQNSSFTDAQYRNKIILGVICHINQSTINLVTNRQNIAYGDSHRIYELVSSFGPIKRSGLAVSAYSTNLRITRAAGAVFSIGCNYGSDQFDADSPSISAANPALLCRVYQNGSGGFIFDVNSGSYYTDIDPNKYDDGSGTLATVNNNQWSIQRLYFFPNNPNDVITYYGRAIYNSYGDAVGALSTETFSEATITAENAVFLGYLVVRGGATNLSTSADAVFFQSGAFRNIGAGGAGGGGGGATPTALDDLSDVAIASPTDSQFLIYDNTSALWKNATLSATSPITFTGVGTSLTLSVSNNAINFNKIQQIATSRVLGRISSGTGDIEELTGANIATIIGANAVQNATNATTAVTSVNLAGGIAGAVVYQANTDTTGFTDAGSAGQVLISDAANKPKWSVLRLSSTARSIFDSGNNELIKFPSSSVASAVNEITITNAATGSAPSISASGDDTHINLDLISKGTGNVLINGKIISLANSFTTSGNFPLSLGLTGATSLTLPTTGTLATTSNKLSDFASTTSAELAGVISDETGSGLLVFATSPTFTTSLVTDSSSFNLFNTTATTISAFGAATSLTIGATTGTTTIRNDLRITGDLTVNGTTTTVNSTVVTIDDPILTLGGDTSVVEVTKDRGIEFKWNGTALSITNYIGNGTTTVTGTVASTAGFAAGDIITISGADSESEQNKLNGTWKIASVPNATTFTFVISSSLANGTYTAGIGSTNKSKNGFFGLDQSSGRFTFIPQANNTSEVFSGSLGDIEVNNGYFSDIYLYDDSVPSNYLQITNSANLTQARTLSINVNDASRTISLSGNLTLANNFVTSGDNSLTLTTTATTNVTLPTTGTLITDAGSYSNPSWITALDAAKITSGTLPGDRGVTAGSANSSFVEYNGTTKTAGQFDGGTTDPTSTTRLNYDGYLYATRFYGDGSNLTGVTGSSFGSQTANTFFAAPNGSAGNPTFRAIVAADIPTLNQNTTGSAATLTTTRTLWGQNFNGSANVTGSLTSVGDITGSSAITITAGGSNQNVTITPSGTGYTLLNGNVGIGTISPTTKLDIVSSNASFPATSGATQATGSILRLRNGNSNLVLDIGGNGGNGNWLQSTNQTDLSLNYPLLLNPNGGNVGIGTTAPTNILDVNGATRIRSISASGSAGTIFLTTDANGVIVSRTATQVRSDIGAGTGNGTVTSVSGTGSVNGITLSGTVSSSGNLTLGGTLSVSGSDFASQTANTFFAAPNGSAGNPTFRAIVAADIPTLNQNTTGSAATLTTTRTLWGQNFNGSANVTGDLTSVGNITGSSGITIAAGDTDKNIIITPSGAGYTRLNGNVGIEVANPTTKLQIGTGTPTSATDGIQFGGDTSARLYRAGSGIIKSSGSFESSAYVYSTTYLQAGNNNIYPNGYTNTLILNSGNSAGNNWVTTLAIAPGGNVGIGVTSPTAKLDVVTATASSTALSVRGTNGTLLSVIDDLSDSLLSVNNSAGLPVLEVFADDRVVMGQYGQNDLIVRNNKVGIGIINPAQKLEVNGAIRAGSFSILNTNTGEAWFGRGSDRTLGSYTLQLGGTSATGTYFEIIDRAWTKVIFSVNGQAPDASFSINSSGNVGISAATPNNKLTVIGAASIGSASYNTAAPTNGLIIEGGVGIGVTSLATSSKVTIAADQAVYNNDAGQLVLAGSTSTAKRLILGYNTTADKGFIQATNTASNYTDLLLNPNGANVGIGTTSPSNTLDVNGTTRIRSISASGSAGTIFLTTDANGVIVSRTATQVRSDIGAGTGSGTVTSIIAGDGLSGGTITSSGTIAVDSTVVRTSGNQTIGGTKTFSSTISGSIDGNAATATTATNATNTAITDDVATNASMYLTWVTAASGNLPQKVSSTKLTFNPSSGTLVAGVFSGSGASLTSLPAGQLSGTIPSGVLGNSTVYIGTTAVALNRTSANLALTGITSIDGNAATVTNGVYTTGSYADPTWITSLAGSKISGNISGNAANVTGTVAIANGGTGATTAANARTNLGATTVGSNFFTLTNPSAVTFPRINADNTVSALDAATFRTAIGAGTGSGTVTSVTLATGTTGTDVNVSNATITSSGTITLNIPDASASARGLITTGSQTIAGDKTFNGSTNAYGGLSVSSGISVSSTAYNVFNKPSVTNYQTVALFGAASTGLFLTDNSPIISTGTYYNGGWIATATNGCLLNFNSNQFVFQTFTGATVGNAPALTTRFTIDGSGNARSYNDFQADGNLSVLGTGSVVRLTLTQTTGTAPLTVSSTTVVSNLNADLLDGQHGSYYTTAGNLSGTIPTGVLGNSSLYIGTTQIALNRASTAQSLTGITSIDGYSASSTRMGSWDGTTFNSGSNSLASSGGRATNLNPNTYQQSISFEFKNGSFSTISGNYAGLITIAPWVGTTASTGDPNYQLLFSPAAVNSTNAPVLQLRAGIDTTWGSWSTILHSSNYNSYAPTLTGTGASGNWAINVTGSAATVTSRTLWGQTYDGSANVSGNLTSVGNITGSSAITITAGGSNQNVTITPSGTGYTLLNGNVGIGTVTPNYLTDLQSTSSPLTLNLKLNKASTTNDYAEIAFQLWSGAGSGANTFGGAGTSRPSVVLRALNEDTGSAAGAFIVGTFTGGSNNTTLNERFRIASGGNVGIATSAPAVLLHIGGSSQTTAAYGLRFGLDTSANLYRSASATVRTDGSLTVGGTVTELSALKYKENISPLNNILNKLCYVQPVTYNKKGEDKKEYGVIAEEVAELFPELVSYNNDGELESVNYSRLTVLLIQAVKELKSEIDKLKKK